MLLAVWKTKGKTMSVMAENVKRDEEERNDRRNNEKELERRAIDEIFKEIAIKQARVQQIGPSGWLDCPLKRTNKRFLSTTIKAAISHNERRSCKEKLSSEEKLLELDCKKTLRPKFGTRKHIYKRLK